MAMQIVPRGSCVCEDPHGLKVFGEWNEVEMHVALCVWSMPEKKTLSDPGRHTKIAGAKLDVVCTM